MAGLAPAAPANPTRSLGAAPIHFVEQRGLELVSGGNVVLPVLKEKLLLLEADPPPCGFTLQFCFPQAQLIRNPKEYVGVFFFSFSFVCWTENKENPPGPSNSEKKALNYQKSMLIDLRP